MGRALFLSTLFHGMLGVLLALAARSYPWPQETAQKTAQETRKIVFVSVHGRQAISHGPTMPKRPRLAGGFSPSHAAPAPTMPMASEGQAKPSLETLYESRVRAALEERKHYPTLARTLGQTGRVVLRFVVEKDGSISRSELLQKSPFPLLNRATEAMLENKTKLEPIPEGLHRLSWEFTLPVDYRLN